MPPAYWPAIAFTGRSKTAVARPTIQHFARNLRRVFDYLRIPENARLRPPVLLAPVGSYGCRELNYRFADSARQVG